jgi:SAM-dependent methyltransferase
MTEGEYEDGYFERRVHDETLRQRAREGEHKRLLAKTGLTGGAVLDIGCGLGEFLALFPTTTWQRFGLEVSEHARERCREQGISFELPAGDGWADLIIFRGSLQHLDRPMETLTDAARWIRPGGWLVALATPNAGGPVYRLFQELPALDPPRNWVVFSDRMLSQILTNLGFAQVSFAYPYRESPYAKPVRDHLRFALRLVGIKRPFAFWRNMMECYARR